METWKQWYQGYSPDFHRYYINNGKRKVHCDRAQLKMAKRGCEYWADLLWNRECYISLTTTEMTEGGMEKAETVDDAQAALDDALEQNNFTWQTNQLVERMMGEGTAAYIVYDVDGFPVVEAISVDYLYPLRWRGRTIEALAAAGVSPNNGMFDSKYPKIVHLMIHDKQPNGTYQVYNLFYGADESESDLKPVDTPSGIRESYTTNVPWFAIFRPNVTDPKHLNNPFGQAIFANSIDTLKNIDLAYDGIHVSMKLGRPRIAVKGAALTMDFEGGEPRPVFDPNDIAFYDMGIDPADDSNKLVQDITTEYRADAFEKSLQAQLQIFSQSIGLGETTFKWDGINVDTAYQAMSINSETARTMRKFQDGIKKPIVDVCRAILEILGLNQDVDIGITFDDSIVVNTEQEKQRWLSMAMAGKIPLWYYLVEFEGLSEADAKAIDLDSLGLNEDEDEGEE